MFKLTREFYTPQGAVKVADKLGDAVAYLSTNRLGKPRATVFFGKQAKPVANFYYSNEAARERNVRELFASRRAALSYKDKRRAERKAWVPTYKVGDAFKTDWGYDQTNVEYFQITELKGRYAILRELQQERVDDQFLAGKCVPLPGTFAEPRYVGDDRGVPIRRLMQEHGIKIDDVRTAHYVPGQNVGGVKVYEPAYWSTGH